MHTTNYHSEVLSAFDAGRENIPGDSCHRNGFKCTSDRCWSCRHLFCESTQRLNKRAEAEISTLKTGVCGRLPYAINLRAALRSALLWIIIRTIFRVLCTGSHCPAFTALQCCLLEIFLIHPVYVYRLSL